ncbi:MAG: hypothetical protein ACQCN4_13795 [Candidatus Bathyarchaeia archaeon]
MEGNFISLGFSIVQNLDDFNARSTKLDKATQNYIQDVLVQAAQAIVLRLPVRTSKRFLSN